MWFNIGAAFGDSAAAAARDDVAKQMTAQQIADAQKIARDYTSRFFKTIES
jgi:hypothetical protein